MNIKNQNDFLKAFSAPGSLDLKGLTDLNKKIQDLKDNPKEDALEQLLELKASIESLIQLAPPMRGMLAPYLSKLNTGISELTIQNKKNESK